MNLLPIIFVGLMICVSNAQISENTTKAIEVPENSGNSSDSLSKSGNTTEKLLDLGKKAIESVKLFNSFICRQPIPISFADLLTRSDNSSDVRKQYLDVINALEGMSTAIRNLSIRIGPYSRNMDLLTIGNNSSSSHANQSEVSQNIIDCMKLINLKYGNSLTLQKYLRHRIVVNYTMHEFINQVFRHKNRVDKMLEEVSKNYLTNNNGYPTLPAYFGSFSRGRCNKNISPNQQLYLLYLMIIVNELKGLGTIAYGYTIRSLLDQGISHEAELDDHFNAFERRLVDYNDRTRQMLANTLIRSNDISRCNVLTNGLVSTRLNYIAESVHNLFFVRMDFKLNNDGQRDFKNPRYNIRISRSRQPSDRLYEWVQTESGSIYGRYNESNDCDGSLIYRSRANNLRLCSSLMYWEVEMITEKRESNISDNMIVTSIRLAVTYNTINIQIKEGKLFPNGLVITKNNKFIGNMQNIEQIEGIPDIHSNFSESLTAIRKFMYLDDVRVDPGYVVTGVQFRESNARDGYKLIVRGTKYDAKSGTLFPHESKWFDPEEIQSHNTEDYSRQRYTLPNNGKKNPYRCSYFSPHETTNEKIEFQHTDLYDDAGQTTVPLLDGQEVYMEQPVPLNGVGLFYNDGYEYGGIIAVRIFTESGERFID